MLKALRNIIRAPRMLILLIRDARARARLRRFSREQRSRSKP